MNLCECGCGQQTIVSPCTDRHHGWKKGEPRRFVRGHGGGPARIQPVVEDRGHETPCHVWPGYLNHAGYARTGSGLVYKVRWEALHGPVPEGMTLDHLCRVRSCVNTAHLEVVTLKENVIRGVVARGSNGHPMRDARHELGLSLGDAGALLGVSGSLIGCWERGTSPMHLGAVQRLRELAENGGPDTRLGLAA